jgi:AcrR family transcriptional regulator
LEEIGAFGLRRSSMQGVARRAGVSRATLYLHWNTKEALFRDLVRELHDQHVDAMRAVLAESLAGGGVGFEASMLAMLEARFLRFVELTSASPHAAELYDLHSRLCGDIARESQQRSEKVLERLLRSAVKRGEVDLRVCGLSAPRVASVLFDCAHGAKGEDASLATPAEFRARLARTVRLLVAGLQQH